MASMISISKAWDATCDFPFRDLEITQWRSSNVKFVYDLEVTSKGQSRSKVKMHFYLLVNIIVFGTLGLEATVKTIRATFTFMILRWPLHGHPRSNFCCGLWKPDIDFPIVFHNHMLISHHQEDIGDFHIRDLEMTPKGQSRSNVKMHFY